MGRLPSEDNEADPGTKYLERDRIKKCVTTMGMLSARAWAREQLPGVSGTEILIGKDLIEGQSWTLSVVLLITVGVVLLSCVFAVIVSHLPTGNVHVTREPAIAKQCSVSPRVVQDDDLDHLNVTDSTWIISWNSEDQLWQLVVSNTRSLCGKLVQFLRYIAIMSENQTNACPWVFLGLKAAMTPCTNPKCQVAHELEYRVVRSAGAADGEIELRAPEEKLVELRSRTPRLRSSTVVRRW